MLLVIQLYSPSFHLKNKLYILMRFSHNRSSENRSLKQGKYKNDEATVRLISGRCDFQTRKMIKITTQHKVVIFRGGAGIPHGKNVLRIDSACRDNGKWFSCQTPWSVLHLGKLASCAASIFRFKLGHFSHIWNTWNQNSMAGIPRPQR